jgi:2-methylaconitate cis-trans-isomerase PrpF
MSAAIGPYAVDEGIVAASGDHAVVRIHNTNTGKIVVSRFALEDGAAAVDGDFVVPGVAGSGAPVRLDFIDPGGAGTGKLLPTSKSLDQLEVAGLGKVEVSMVDAANPCVFVAAAGLGLMGIEMPSELEAAASVLQRLRRYESQPACGWVLRGTLTTPLPNQAFPRSRWSPDLKRL